MVFGGKSDSWLVWGCLYSWYWNCYKTGTKPVLCSSSSLYQGGIGISLVLPQVISLVGSFLLVSTFVDTRWWRLVCQASGYGSSTGRMFKQTNKKSDNKKRSAETNELMAHSNTWCLEMNYAPLLCIHSEQNLKWGKLKISLLAWAIESACNQFQLSGCKLTVN